MGQLQNDVKSEAYVETHAGVLIIDEGEKDGNGIVLVGCPEGCNDCGGRILWATRGEHLMICESCGEPQ